MARLVNLVNVKKTQQRCIKRTAEIVIGDTYFLSSFYDKTGAVVKVIDKSTAENSCGWNSTVTVEVLHSIDDAHYKPGKTHTVNATNLYEQRYLADPAQRRA